MCLYMSLETHVEGCIPAVDLIYLRRTGMDTVGGDLKKKNRPQKNRDMGNKKNSMEKNKI